MPSDRSTPLQRLPVPTSRRSRRVTRLRPNALHVPAGPSKLMYARDPAVPSPTRRPDSVLGRRAPGSPIACRCGWPWTATTTWRTSPVPAATGSSSCSRRPGPSTPGVGSTLRRPTVTTTSVSSATSRRLLHGPPAAGLGAGGQQDPRDPAGSSVCRMNLGHSLDHLADQATAAKLCVNGMRTRLATSCRRGGGRRGGVHLGFPRLCAHAHRRGNLITVRSRLKVGNQRRPRWAVAAAP